MARGYSHERARTYGCVHRNKLTSNQKVDRRPMWEKHPTLGLAVGAAQLGTQLVHELFVRARCLHACSVEATMRVA